MAKKNTEIVVSPNRPGFTYKVLVGSSVVASGYRSTAEQAERAGARELAVFLKMSAAMDSRAKARKAKR